MRRLDSRRPDLMIPNYCPGIINESELELAWTGEGGSVDLHMPMMGKFRSMQMKE